MTTQTKSKVLLTALILAGMSPSCYFLSTQYALYGLALLVGGLALLAWVWKPWQKSGK